jgi:2-polyprenyl-3-methyl-5-hydroxy-6-metoxy-1,4-benzoquinol methylase
MRTIEEVLTEVEQIVQNAGVENDIIYFKYHKKRFRQMAQTIAATCPQGSEVLDIGSHYLHSALILHLLGYKVSCMDVQEFWDLGHIRKRAETYQLTAIVENNLEKLTSLEKVHDQYDLILFAEIFEHITFNPVNFWKKMHSLVRNNGIIYLTTPNSLTLYAILKTIFNVARFKGIGIDINAVLGTVTYGHHWKEYSSREIKQYFDKLNNGFKVSINKFHYQAYPAQGIKSRLRKMVVDTGNLIPYFRDAIEAVIRVDKTQEWKIDPPAY